MNYFYIQVTSCINSSTALSDKNEKNKRDNRFVTIQYFFDFLNYEPRVTSTPLFTPLFAF